MIETLKAALKWMIQNIRVSTEDLDGGGGAGGGGALSSSWDITPGTAGITDHNFTGYTDSSFYRSHGDFLDSSVQSGSFDFPEFSPAAEESPRGSPVERFFNAAQSAVTNILSRSGIGSDFSVPRENLSEVFAGNVQRGAGRGFREKKPTQKYSPSS